MNFWEKCTLTLRINPRMSEEALLTQLTIS